jgi:hypothetical protein
MSNWTFTFNQKTEIFTFEKPSDERTEKISLNDINAHFRACLGKGNDDDLIYSEVPDGVMQDAIDSVASLDCVAA